MGPGSTFPPPQSWGREGAKLGSPAPPKQLCVPRAGQAGTYKPLFGGYTPPIPNHDRDTSPTTAP